MEIMKNCDFPALIPLSQFICFRLMAFVVTLGERFCYAANKKIRSTIELNVERVESCSH